MLQFHKENIELKWTDETIEMATACDFFCGGSNHLIELF